MPFLNNIIHGVRDASKVIQHAVRATGRGLHRVGKAVYENRDLVARGIALAAPVVSAGVAGLKAGGIGGAVVGAGGAILSEKEDIGKFVGDVKDRIKGKTKGGDIDPKLKQKAKDEVMKRIPGVGGDGGTVIGGSKVPPSVRQRLKVMAQGQSI